MTKIWQSNICSSRIPIHSCRDKPSGLTTTCFTLVIPFAVVWWHVQRPTPVDLFTYQTHQLNLLQIIYVTWLKKPTPECILTNPLQSGKAYRVFAPTGDEATSVICYNLNTSPSYQEVESFIKREDYFLRENIEESARFSSDSILAFNWEKQSAEVLTASERKIKLSGFTDCLFHLCPIRKGWAVIGIQEKYLSPATVQILERSADTLILDVHCTGTLRIWADSGKKQELRSIPIRKTGRIEIKK